jgi:hypothetical protein
MTGGTWVEKGGELDVLSPADKAEMMAKIATVSDDKTKPELKPLWTCWVSRRNAVSRLLRKAPVPFGQVVLCLDQACITQRMTSQAHIDLQTVICQVPSVSRESVAAAKLQHPPDASLSIWWRQAFLAAGFNP